MSGENMGEFQPIAEPQILTLEAVLASSFSVSGDLLFPQKLAEQTLKNVEAAESSLVYQHLRTPNLREKAHLRAAYYWLNLYVPPANGKRLTQMQGYLEAAHHLKQIQAWELIAQILVLRPRATEDRFLWQKLADDGLFRQTIEICLPLIGKVDDACDRLCWQGLGEAYIHLGQYPEAIAAWESLLQLAAKTSSLLLEATALEALARCYGNWGKYRQALNYAQQSLSCLQETPKTNDSNDIERQKAKTLTTLSYIHIHLRQYRHSIACGEAALAIARRIGDLETQWYALGRLAVSYAQRGQGQKALASLEQQYQQRYQNQDLRQVSALLVNLTLLCCYQRQLKLASQYVRESWEMHREIGDVNGQCYALLMSGFIQLWQDNYDSATAYFQQSLTQAKIYGYKHHIAISLAQLSYIHSATHRLASASKLAKQALAISRKTDNAFFQASSLAALGLAYLAQGKVVQSFPLLAKSIFTIPSWKNGDGKLLLALIGKRLFQHLTSNRFVPT